MCGGDISIYDITGVTCLGAWDDLVAMEHR